MDRRELLRTLGSGAALLTLGELTACVSSPKPSPVASPAPYLAGAKRGQALVCLEPRRRGVSTIRIFDWDRSAFEDVDLPIGTIHSLAMDSTDPNSVFAFELFGSCAKVDLKSRATVKIDNRPTGLISNGHGAVCPSGEFVACTEIDRQKGGYVALRSTKDLKSAFKLSKRNDFAHQVAHLPGSNLLVAGGMKDESLRPTGAFTFFDADTREVVNRIEFPEPILHLLTISSTEVVGVTLPTDRLPDDGTLIWGAEYAGESVDRLMPALRFTPGPIYYASVHGKKKILWDEKQKQTFVNNFGLAKVDSKSFLSGHIDAGKVIWWKDYAIHKVFDVPKVKNLLVSADGKELMAISGNRLVGYSLETFEPIDRYRDWPAVSALSYASRNITV